MQAHPAVAESLFYGKPAPEVQELICAVVVLKPGMKVINCWNNENFY
jgi:acyl-coenzyme A synthetase/AMP-(fatty) acid ligase